MLRNKLVILVVGVLFTLVFIYNINFFLKKKARAVAPQKAISAVPADDQSMAVGPRMTSHIPLPRDKENWKRDPFLYMGQYTGEKGEAGRPAAREKKKAAGIKLEGITVRDGKCYALVNGWVVEAGDSIEDVLITRVTSYSIFVRDAGGLREISIYNDIPDKEK